MIQRLLASILMFCSGHCCIAQMNQNTNLPNIMPSNPSQYQFMKYGEVPVGKYTGVPNIDIPIYTINAKGLDIPIALSYHSNGFKVNEEAGWTGLGWSLQAGGAINQIVSGSDDFGYYQSRSIPDFQAIDPSLPLSAQGTCSQFYIQGYLGNNGDNTNLNNILCADLTQGISLDARYPNGYLDSEPDVFKFSMLNYSGSFLLDWQNNVFVCLSNSDYKIECTSYTGSTQAPATFYITVTDGHRFKFELKEDGEYIVHTSVSEEYGGTSSGPDLRMPGERAFRTYQLTEITTAKGDMITYNYSLSNDVIGYPSVSKSLSSYTPRYEGASIEIPGFKTYDVNSTILIIKQKYSVLNSIIFTGGSINFYTSSRTDIVGAQKLDQITVKNTTPSTTVKTFNFSYGYFQGAPQGTNLNEYFSYYPSGTVSKTNNELTQRLKLLSVTETGQPPYVFEYNESLTLPEKTSLATDYWGFYNGYLTNYSLFPNLYSFNVERDNILLGDYENNFKGASLEHSKTAVLKKLTYPTKGYSEFNYELNSFNNYAVPSAQQGVLSTVSISTMPGYNRQKAVIINGGNTIFKGNAFLSTTGCTNPEAYSSCYIKIQHFKKELLSYITGSATLNSHYNNFGLLYVLGADLDFIDGSPSNPTLYNQYKDMPEVFRYKLSSGSQDENLQNLLYNLTEGIAVFTVSGGCGVYGSGSSSSSSGNISQGTLNLTYHNYQPLASGDSFGGGLRVASIFNYTGNSVAATKKKFTYENGKLMTPMIYAYRSPFMLEEQIPVPIGSCIVLIADTEKLVLSSSNFATLSTSASGNYVGYSKVTEETIDKDYVSGPVLSTQGKTITYFTNNADQSSISLIMLNYPSNAVILPPVQADLDNGLVVKEEYYSNALLLKDENNVYMSDANSGCFYGAKYAFVKKLGDHAQCSYASCTGYEIGAYSVKKRGKSKILISITNEYAGGSTLSSTKNFGYDAHRQLNYLKNVSSNGDIVEIYNNYPYDFTGDVIYNGMFSKNQISPIVKSIKKVNGSITSVEQDVYTFINYVTVDNIFYPSKYVLYKKRTAKTGNDVDLEDRLIYYNFDIYGNPTEVSLANGPHVSYIWGYKGRYPIAQVENTTYSSISSYASVLQTASNNGTLAVSSFTNLRNGLSSAMVTSYTYKPCIGVSTITDPKGYTIYYEYDPFGRLEFVKDKDPATGYFRLLSENQYNYRP